MKDEIEHIGDGFGYYVGVVLSGIGDVRELGGEVNVVDRFINMLEDGNFF